MSLIENLAVRFLKSYVRYQSPKPGKSESHLNLDGVKQSVDIIRDKWGVPHIYAQNLDDLAFAQGFTQAQDRLWQMEINRRVARGKLSEIAGEITVDTDRATRTLGFERLARVDFEFMDEVIERYLMDFIRGINTYIDLNYKNLPAEYTLLKFKPEPWNELDILSFSRMLAWQLSFAWHGKLIRQRIIEAVGVERAKDLEPNYPNTNPSGIDKNAELNLITDNGIVAALNGPFLQQLGGSNSWVISGERSDSGHPILCNDPHLPMMQPAIWYENHLCTPDFETTGVTLAGVPMVMIGHNRDITWGMTLAFTDIQDIYIEKFKQDDDSIYHYNGEELQAKIIDEHVKIKGKPDHTEKVIVTRHGPVISDIVGEKNLKLSLRSKALDKLEIMNGWYNLNQAKNWNDFVKAMKHVNAPALNVTYADRHGNIGYWVTGEVPIRKNGIPSTPVPGWTDDNEWIDIIPFEQMPHTLNPAKGYIVSCNHKIIGEDYPFDLGNAWMNGYRAKRFEQLMQDHSKTSLTDMEHFQMDVKCLPASSLIEHYQTFKADDSKLVKALDHLFNWDGFLTTKSIGGAIYGCTKHFLVKNLINNQLNENLFNEFRGASFNHNLIPQTEFYGYDTITLLRLLEKDDNWWVSQAGGKENLLRLSLQQAIDLLESMQGTDMLQWQWGKLHQASFQHSLGLQPPMNKVLNQGPFPVPGDTDTLFQTATMAHDPAGDHVIAPSYRQIIDTGDWSKSRCVLPPGNSGNVRNPNYGDQTEMWLNGEFRPMLWNKKDILAQKVSVIKISPTSE